MPAPKARTHCTSRWELSSLGFLCKDLDERLEAPRPPQIMHYIIDKYTPITSP